ncbi:MAG TPA: hypothetical protein VEL07_15800 [Planctomycetota bacterium]|nr:hypothetical protein [Planctomycetota bacterium]
MRADRHRVAGDRRALDVHVAGVLQSRPPALTRLALHPGMAMAISATG